MNIWVKRKELNAIIQKFDDSVAFFSCLTAMESGEFRRKLREKKRRITNDARLSGSDTDNDYETIEEEGIIPGKSI